MFTVGGITFLSPVLLAALAAVPVIWWLLRVMPPRPKSIKFPAFFLLKDIRSEVKTAAHTPWWLLVLRSLILIFFILALADPVLKLSAGLPGQGAVLIAVDTGWPAAANWQARQDKLKEFVTLLRRAKRSVIFLPTAPEPQDGKVHGFGPMEAADAEEWVERLKPQPWPRDAVAAAGVAAEMISAKHATYAIYLSDGTAESAGDSAKLLAALQGSGGLTLVTDEEINTSYILRRTESPPAQIAFQVERLAPKDSAETLAIAAEGQDGGVLDTYKFDFPAGQKRTDIKWDLLSEMRNKIARFSLVTPRMASATVLTDSRWRQRPVGIIADPSRKDSAGFLNEVYYLRRALEANGVPEVDVPGELLKKPLSAMIWPDSAALTALDRADLVKWVEEGGFLVRFAGPNLSANPEDDPLLPVRLRYGERALDGAMTWEKPRKLGAIPEQSPLYGLTIPADATVTRQLLADPTPEVFERTWLQLDDGTPLITGGNVGKGFVVLIHTTAGPDWSDFCYSGLYVEALQRMISLSAGIAGYKADLVLPPLSVMDGFGRLQPPERRGVISSVDPKQGFTPSAATPPGLYGDERQFQVYNLGDALGPMQALANIPDGAKMEAYSLTGERSMRDSFLKAALALLLLDTLLTLWLRGAFAVPARGAALAIFLSAALLSVPARAQEAAPADLTSYIYLAYVKTGDSDADTVSAAGLTALKAIVNGRTTIRVQGVQGVDPDSDALYFYPFLYWPMTAVQPPLSVTAARNIQNYMARGGMILFDTRDQQFASPAGSVNSATIGARKLRELTGNIRIPELIPVESGHILTKSFYLLDEFPGAYAGGRIWVEKEPSPSHDSVTSVVIGGNDWAGAWSRDSRFIVTPGGEEQRERAYRFGVNLLMVALTGNYKSDQVHVPFILERMQRR